jgi:hypothetical protein
METPRLPICRAGLRQLALDVLPPDDQRGRLGPSLPHVTRLQPHNQRLRPIIKPSREPPGTTPPPHPTLPPHHRRYRGPCAARWTQPAGSRAPSRPATQQATKYAGNERAHPLRQPLQGVQAQEGGETPRLVRQGFDARGELLQLATVLAEAANPPPRAQLVSSVGWAFLWAERGNRCAHPSSWYSADSSRASACGMPPTHTVTCNARTGMCATNRQRSERSPPATVAARPQRTARTGWGAAGKWLCPARRAARGNMSVHDPGSGIAHRGRRCVGGVLPDDPLHFDRALQLLQLPHPRGDVRLCHCLRSSIEAQPGGQARPAVCQNRRSPPASLVMPRNFRGVSEKSKTGGHPEVRPAVRCGVS